jgi:soluble lytic murein transglycosylase-like protein
MTRGRVIALALLAALLVSDGMTSRPAPAGAVASEALPAIDAPAIEDYLAGLNPQLSERQRARIAAAVLRSSARHGLDPSLVVAVMVAESSARPWARSTKGAVGLMQVMPHMHREMALAGGLASIETNVEAGCAILADNIGRLGEERGILAYFWGNNIRGGAYLERVEAARRAFYRQLAS